MGISTFIEKLSIATVGAAVMALGIGEVAQANVLTFEDTNSYNLTFINNGYSGLNWSNFGLIADYTYPGSGYDNGTVSGVYTAFNNGAQPANISGRLFDFNGTYLTSAWDSFLNVEVRGYRSGQLTNSQVVTANRNAPTWFNFNFFDIDRLEFISHGWHLAMDNLTINAPRLREFYLNGSNSNTTISEGQSVSAFLTATDREFSSDNISFFLNGSHIGTAFNSPSDFHPDNWFVDKTGMGTSLGTFADNGTFTYTAQARDQYGVNGNTISRTVTVLNVAPILTGFNLSNNTILEGQSATATFSATDPGSDAVSFLLNGNNVGTNTNISGTRSLTTNLGTFADNGTVTYTGQAKDDDGGLSSTASQTLTILNVAPTITEFDLSSYEIYEGQSISALFKAIDPGADAISFWINGVNVGADAATSGIRSLNNANLGIFADDGTFTINGQAKDDDGGLSSILSKYLRVLNVDPVINSLTSGLFGRQLNFSAFATDAGINDLLSFEWDFDGDGEYDDFFGDSGVWDFKKNGLYNVGLRVSDGDGGFAYQSFEVGVSVPESSSVLGLLGCSIFGVGAIIQGKKSGKA